MVPARTSRTMQAIMLLGALACPITLRAQSVAVGDSILAYGDTTAAIAAYELAVKKNLHDTEAHYKAGMLRMTRFSTKTNLSEDRRKAEEHFQYAARFASDSAKYWLALAEAFRTESGVTVRLQVANLVGKALDAAHKFGSAVTAAVEYRAGVIYWERYEPLAHRYMFWGDARTGTQLGVSQEELYADWNYAERFVEQQVKPDPGDAGAADRISTEDHLRAALIANPRHIRAAGLLTVLMGENERWPEALDVTRRLVRAAPDSGRAWALWGMALTRANRWAEAQRTFDSALAHMTPKQRAPYDNLLLLLGADGRQQYQAFDSLSKSSFNSMYWAVAQPLFLTERNEVRTEFYTRLTYVAHRWGDPLRGYEGYESDRGVVYLRYGPPDVWASLGTESGADMGANGILWLYRPTKMRFLFAVTPGYAKATFSGDFREFYREASNARPVRYDNVGAVRNLDTVDVQVAQFRPDTGRRTDIAVFAFMPVGRMARSAARLQLELQTAAIVKDSRMRDVVRERQDARVQGGDSLQVERHTWRLSLAPQEYLLHVEARLPVLERAARSAGALNVRSFAGDTLMMSDVIMAGRLSPKDSAATRWSDFFLEPSSGRFDPQQPVSLLWEIYNLVPDSSGIARYRVELRVTVKEVERHGFSAQLLGVLGDATGLSARGDDAVSLGYNRQVRTTRGGRQIEYLTLNLQNAPNANYEVKVQITDQLTGRITFESRRLTVTPTPLTR
jgi:GWxTD domain-containing protein